MIRFVLAAAVWLVTSSAFAQGAGLDALFLSGPGEACRTHDECGTGLVCKSGACKAVDRLNRGEVGEFCSGPAGGANECLSGRCADNLCAPTIRNRGANNTACTTDIECQSNVCKFGICMPSKKAQGLPGSTCVADPDCLSNLCLQGEAGKVCAYDARRAASCAPLGTPVNLPVECCSLRTQGGVCAPAPQAGCTLNGNCKGVVGRICADIGYPAVNALQCCSGKANGGRCVINIEQRVQPCRLDRACRSGMCNEQTGTCVDRLIHESDGRKYQQKSTTPDAIGSGIGNGIN